jgi:muconate cycloisomerase
MKIVKCKIYLMKIPFQNSFNHHLKKRNFSDSIILELTTDSGLTGYGEGIARPYVTNETREQCIHNLRNITVPSLKTIELCDTKPSQFLKYINEIIPKSCLASRTAAELAILDLLLQKNSVSLSSILPTYYPEVVYSGVLSADDIESCRKRIMLFKDLGLEEIKIKLNGTNDVERVELARELLGEGVSIRLDANGAFTAEEALKLIKKLKKYNIASVEQPTPKADFKGMAEVTSSSNISIMADESLVTINDAKQLIEFKTCDSFNIRIAKCGGLYNTLKIIKLAKENQINLQLGCLVGETAILSAVGRQLAACKKFDFIEGSYSTLLLKKDICNEEIVWGKGGKAKPLTGTSFGITINKSVLTKYAEEIIDA